MYPKGSCTPAYAANRRGRIDACGGARGIGQGGPDIRASIRGRVLTRKYRSHHEPRRRLGTQICLGFGVPGLGLPPLSLAGRRTGTGRMDTHRRMAERVRWVFHVRPLPILVLHRVCRPGVSDFGSWDRASLRETAQRPPILERRPSNALRRTLAVYLGPPS